MSLIGSFCMIYFDPRHHNHYTDMYNVSRKNYNADRTLSSFEVSNINLMVLSKVIKITSHRRRHQYHHLWLIIIIVHLVAL